MDKGIRDAHEDEEESPHGRGLFASRTKKRSKSRMQKITMKNGKPAIQGTCPLCGGKVFRIGG
jgi:hypothetical protein